MSPDPDKVQGTYRTFVRNARFVTPDSAPHIAFMAACVVEMHSLDMGAAYEHAFSAVRQLAQLLRAGLAQRSQQALQEVYSWPTLHALELWARLLSSLSDRAVCALISSSCHSFQDCSLPHATVPIK